MVHLVKIRKSTFAENTIQIVEDIIINRSVAEIQPSHLCYRTFKSLMALKMS
jgi:hypothetical protein